MNFIGWGGGIRLTSGEPGTARDEHGSSGRFPCEMPLAFLTPNVLDGVEAFVSSNRHLNTIENSRKSEDLREVSMAGVEGFEPPNAWTKTMC
ncbi:MAG: hypothetical protein WAW62_03970, partial [Candidatus Saccharimonas aalborgensis]